MVKDTFFAKVGGNVLPVHVKKFDLIFAESHGSAGVHVGRVLITKSALTQFRALTPVVSKALVVPM